MLLGTNKPLNNEVYCGEHSHSMAYQFQKVTMKRTASIFQFNYFLVGQGLVQNAHWQNPSHSHFTDEVLQVQDLNDQKLPITGNITTGEYLQWLLQELKPRLYFEIYGCAGKSSQ